MIRSLILRFSFGANNMRETKLAVRLTAFIAMVALSGVATAGTVYVPAPTGVPAIDWQNIQQAVDRADKGDTVRFRRGVYVLGADSDFIVIKAPGVQLKGHRRGTTIVGGDVLPTVDQIGSPYLMGNNSLLQSPPRGFRLTADKQRISRIRFKSFRTALFIGFGDSVKTGGYVVEHCKFLEAMYGIQAHVESDEVTAIRGNTFINNTFPYDVSGGKYHVSFNYQATPDPQRVPIDDFTHHSGDVAAGGPFYDEGGAFVTENNVFEFNVVDGGSEGIQVIGDLGGVVRNNVFRNNQFYDMRECPSWTLGDCFGTFSVIVTLGGDVVDNIWVNNTLDRTDGIPLASLNFGGSIDGNVIVDNELRSIANGRGLAFNSGTALDGALPIPTGGATNSIFLDNVITGDDAGDLANGGLFFGGNSNQFLLNITDAANAALFINSPDGLFASENPNDRAVDQDGNLVESLDPNQDFGQLRSCKKILTDTESDEDDDDHHDRDDDDYDDDDVTVGQVVEEFSSCVNEAVGELH